MAVSSGKRLARHMRKVVGAWLAGLYDSDRLVARAAQEALDQIFPTQEKMLAVWRVYTRAIMEYAHDAVLRETAQTLSDERTVSPDDAEAKHARVVGTGLSLLSHLLGASSPLSSPSEPDFCLQSTSTTQAYPRRRPSAKTSCTTPVCGPSLLTRTRSSDDPSTDYFDRLS